MTQLSILNVYTHPDKAAGRPTPALSIDVHPLKCDRFATGGSDTVANIWCLTTDSDEGVEKIASLRMHEKSVNVVRWSPKGRFLATTGGDSAIVIWTHDKDNPPPQVLGEVDLKERWKSIHTMRSYTEISDMCWSPDGTYIAAVNPNHKLFLWHVPTSRLIQDLDVGAQYVQGVVWNPRGKWIAIQNDMDQCKVFLQKPGTRGKELRFEEYEDLVRLHIRNPDGSVKAKADPKPRDQIMDVDLDSKQPEPVAPSPMTNNVKATGSKTASSGGSTVGRGKSKHSGPPSALNAVREGVNRLFMHEIVHNHTKRPGFSPDGRFLATAGGQHLRDGKRLAAVHVFDLTNIQGHVSSYHLDFDSPVMDIKFNPRLYELVDEPEPLTPVAKYNMKYTQIFAAIAECKAIVFDLSRVHPVFIWEDNDIHSFTDSSWASKGAALFLTDNDGFVTRIAFDAADFGRPQGWNVDSTYKVPGSELNSEVDFGIQGGKKALTVTASTPGPPSAVKRPLEGGGGREDSKGHKKMKLDSGVKDTGAPGEATSPASLSKKRKVEQGGAGASEQQTKIRKIDVGSVNILQPIRRVNKDAAQTKATE